MTDREELAPTSGEPDSVLLELTEQIAERLQAGEPVEAADYLDCYPQWASTIRRLLPTMNDLVAYGRAVDADWMRRQKPNPPQTVDGCNP